jgi:hypothetical protein
MPSANERALGLEFVSRPEAGPPPPSRNELLAAAWQYGYGAYDEAAKRVARFTPLSHFNGSAWQGGAAMPDAQSGWATLTADGGHAGSDQERAAIRRWTAPRDGVVRIEGNLKLAKDEGDGVRARIVSSASGPAGEWTLEPKKKPEKTTADKLTVKAGDTIDFVVDPRASAEHDSYVWTVVVELQPAAADAAAVEPIAWDSAATFRTPKPPPTDVWTRYAQVLLLSNEFVFVD